MGNIFKSEIPKITINCVCCDSQIDDDVVDSGFNSENEQCNDGCRSEWEWKDNICAEITDGKSDEF